MSGQGEGAHSSLLPASLDAALAALRTELELCGDVVFRPFTLVTDPPVKAAVVYCKSVSDAASLSENLLEPVMLKLAVTLKARGFSVPAGDACELLQQIGLPAGQVQAARTVKDSVEGILSGDAAVLVDGCTGALLVEAKSQVGRNVMESQAEGVVRGPRDSMVEVLETSLTLLRRRLPVKEFRLLKRKVGQRTRTEVAIIYLDGLPHPGVVEEVCRRIDRIEIDGVLDPAYLEELIEDEPRTPFPTIEHTERPDKVVAALLEGRVAILTDHSPYALLVPVVFTQFLQAAEDYYERYFISTGLRLLRFLAFLIALTLPSIYVATTTYHHEMIPSDLFIAIAAQREGVPWPAIVEAILMEASFELLREAGVRLPRPVGQAVSIIGGLVVGEAAIQARIASPAMVIIVAMTGIASFAIPSFSLATTLRLIRFALMILASVLGLHGLTVGLLMVVIHMAGLKSFSVPYLAPVAPAIPQDWKDTVVRAPWWQMNRRPRSLKPDNRQRLSREELHGRGEDR